MTLVKPTKQEISDSEAVEGYGVSITLHSCKVRKQMRVDNANTYTRSTTSVGHRHDKILRLVDAVMNRMKRRRLFCTYSTMAQISQRKKRCMFICGFDATEQIRMGQHTRR